jgi:hypothetical protein
MNTLNKNQVKDRFQDWSAEEKDPSWLSSDTYSGNEKWGYRRWAWEFLSRNPKSRSLFLGSTETRAAACRRFGLVNLPNLRSVDKDSKERYWLSELVSEHIACRKSDEVNVGLNLKRGQVAIVFDLSQTIHAGRAAIDSLLSDARAKLFEELDWYETELAARNMPTPKVFKPRRNSLLRWLTLCDALAADATDEQLIPVLYPGDPLKTAKKRLAGDKVRAKEMMRQGYLTLVPLAHIQDKSLLKKRKPAVARRAKNE